VVVRESTGGAAARRSTDGARDGWLQQRVGQQRGHETVVRGSETAVHGSEMAVARVSERRRKTVRRRGAVSAGQLRQWRKHGGARELGKTATRVRVRRTAVVD
jgi:hypothetical protein